MYMDPSQGPKNVNCTRHKVPKLYMDPSQGPKNVNGPVTRSQKCKLDPSQGSTHLSGPALSKGMWVEFRSRPFRGRADRRKGLGGAS